MQAAKNILGGFARWKKWSYIAKGGIQRLYQRQNCPCCGCDKSQTIDRKLSYTLQLCNRCRILFRFPNESEENLRRFYQHKYSEPGLTTELPSEAKLSQLVATSFKSSPKDFSRVISIVQALGLHAGHRVLDFGANWGYGTWQMRQAGFEAEGFEVSVPRSEYGRRLGIHLYTRLDEVGGSFDAVYSGHVLEHVENPLKVIVRQLSLTRPGGIVLAHTPNGSAARQRADWNGFRLNWGEAHPFLLTAEFVARNFGAYPYFVAADTDLKEIRAWDRISSYIGDTYGGELFLAILNTRNAK